MDYCESPLSVVSTDINSIRNGSSWLGASTAFYDFVDSAKLLTGTDIRQNIEAPDWNEIREDALRNIGNITQIAIEADATQFVLSGISTRMIFGGFFSLLHLFNALSKEFSRDKKTLVEQAIQTLGDDDGESRLVRNMNHIWQNFICRDLWENEFASLKAGVLELSKKIALQNSGQSGKRGTSIRH